MPSFFEGLKRMLSGQPVFQAGEDTDEPISKQERDELEDVPEKPEYPHTAQPIPQAPQAEKPRPQVVIERVECRPDGPNMEITVHIKNMSGEKVTLDKIFLFNTRHELDRELDPGERNEFVNVYYGPRPNHRNYTHCEVQYQDSIGKYYTARHNVEFRQEADNTYTIDRIRFIPPINEIY